MILQILIISFNFLETALDGSSSNEEEEYQPQEVSTATGQDIPLSMAVVGKP